MRKLIFFVLLLFCFISCEKEPNDVRVRATEVNTDVSTNKTGGNDLGDYDDNMLYCVENDLVEYYLNGIKVAPGTYNPTDERLFGVVEGDSSQAFIRFNMFTDIKDYFQFGRNNGYGNTLEGEYNFQREMVKYVEENDIEEYYNLYGDAPQSYYDFELTMYKREIIDNQDRGLAVLYKDWTGGGSTTTLTGYKPFFMDASYDNQISRYTQYLSAGIVVGFMSVYDNKFYKKKVGPTLGKIVWTWVVFHSDFGLSYLNDKMSSCISI